MIAPSRTVARVREQTPLLGPGAVDLPTDQLINRLAVSQSTSMEEVQDDPDELMRLECEPTMATTLGRGGAENAR